jgi:hypothetical protein
MMGHGAAVLAALDSITTAAYDSTANHDAPKRSEWQESPAALGTTACGAFSCWRGVDRARYRTNGGLEYG